MRDLVDTAIRTLIEEYPTPLMLSALLACWNKARLDRSGTKKLLAELPTVTQGIVHYIEYGTT